uniref:RRM domain-containing protein n=1 Tax=Angiostrongylus cantonensis TaxID=6313 RepID=A0A0K0D3H5_ANGCA
MARVYLGRLPFRARESDIERFFQGYGKITDIAMKRGFAFIEFESKRDAEDAVDELNGRSILGDRVVPMAAMFTVIVLVHAPVIANVVAVHVLEVAIEDEAEVQEEDVVAREAVVALQEDADLEEGVIPAVREAAAGHLRRSVVLDVAAGLRNVISVHQKRDSMSPSPKKRRTRSSSRESADRTPSPRNDKSRSASPTIEKNGRGKSSEDNGDRSPRRSRSRSPGGSGSDRSRSVSPEENGNRRGSSSDRSVSDRDD